MNVHVLFFAAIREEVGCSDVYLDLSGSISKEEFLTKLEAEIGSDRFHCLTAENVSIALNQELQKGAFQVAAGDEIAFMPPITGG